MKLGNKTFLEPIFVWTQNMFGDTSFLDPDFSTPFFLDPTKIILEHNFWTKNYFRQKIATINFLDLTVFRHKFFGLKILLKDFFIDTFYRIQIALAMEFDCGVGPPCINLQSIFQVEALVVWDEWVVVESNNCYQLKVSMLLFGLSE